MCALHTPQVSGTVANTMQCIFGSDRNGAAQAAILVDALKDVGTCIDVSNQNATDTDYIQVSAAVCRLVVRRKAFGVLLCGTGAGTAICANKHKGVYAVSCFDPEHARAAKRINNANVLCLAATTPVEVNLAIIRAFFTTHYRGRKPHRIAAVRALERKLFSNKKTNA